MKTFEKPLSVEEENKYFQEYKMGSEAAKEILVLRNMRLVAHMVKKYSDNERNKDDMISIGTIGLIKAIMSYDYEKGSKFSTYAVKCIDNELLMMLRGERKTNKEVSMYEPIGTDKEGNEISLLDVIESDNSDFVKDMCDNDDRKWMYESLDRVLTEREREIIILRYGLFGKEEYTQKQIADMKNISRSYVSRIEKKALSKLYEDYMLKNKDCKD